MRIASIIIICAFWVNGLSAQEASGNYELPFRIFAAPIFEYSQMNDLNANGFGAGMGVALDNGWIISGYVTSIKSDSKQYNDTLSVNARMVHGGLWLGYDFVQEKKWSLIGAVRTGFGNAIIEDANQSSTKYVYYDKDWIYVIQPQVEIEYPIGTWLRLNVYGGYRFIPKMNLALVEKDGFLSGVFGVNLKFGLF